MEALHAFGVEQGAEYAFLQVAEDNVPAVNLYRGLGYEPLYRYWYRRADARPDGT
jgi:ribosomal protein S18 acetylase RimI-like enzyme